MILSTARPCTVTGCDEPRARTGHQCAQHRLEYGQAWRAAHPGYMQRYYAEHRDRWQAYAATQRAKRHPVAIPTWRRLLDRLRGFLAFLTSPSLLVAAIRTDDGDGRPGAGVDPRVDGPVAGVDRRPIPGGNR